MRLENKTAFITGAGSGIGQGTAVRFVKEGARVIISDINPDGLKETEKLIREAGGECISVILDVASEEQWIQAHEVVKREFGVVDILVQSAGIDCFGEFQSFSVEFFRNMLDIDVIGVWLGMKHLVPDMMEAGKGSVVNISSAAGLKGTWGMCPYGTAKGAVTILSQCVAAETADYGVRVNTVHPGNTKTPMIMNYFNQGSTMESLSSWSPLKRLATIEEQVNGILYLASDESSYCTGTQLTTEGGFANIDYANHE